MSFEFFSKRKNEKKEESERQRQKNERKKERKFSQTKGGIRESESE